MEFKMNLRENMEDFLYNSLDYYIIADESGTHDPQRSNIENKKKWKIAFIFLVQAVELLIKEALYRVNPSLVYENIDSPSLEEGKTVSFSKSVRRLINFAGEIMSAEEIRFINNCSLIRNEFIHYEVKIESPEIKAKYCKLFMLFCKLYGTILKEKMNFDNPKYNLAVSNISLFAKHLTVFRGIEVKKEWLEDIKKDIELNNKRYIYYKNSEGKLIQRIKYGDEDNVLNANGIHYPFSHSEFDYCADCTAKKGEYHLDGCDWEICPVCFQQKLSCGCELVLSDAEGNEYISPYEMH